MRWRNKYEYKDWNEKIKTDSRTHSTGQRLQDKGNKEKEENPERERDKRRHTQTVRTTNARKR